jgi:hypothetical protein
MMWTKAETPLWLLAIFSDCRDWEVSRERFFRARYPDRRTGEHTDWQFVLFAMVDGGRFQACWVTNEAYTKAAIDVDEYVFRKLHTQMHTGQS